MPLPIGSPAEVPCVVCHERVPGLAWGERCGACRAKRRRRAHRLARGISLLAALVAALILAWQVTPGPNARVWIGFGTLVVFFLSRAVAYRVASEMLPD